MRNTDSSKSTSYRLLGDERCCSHSPGLPLPDSILASLEQMKRLLIIFLAVAGIGLGFLAYYLYGGSTVPTGQQPLTRLTDSNLSSLKNSFNGSADSVRVIVMLSPT